MKSTCTLQSFVTAGLAALALLVASSPCQAQMIPASGPGSALTIPQPQLIQPDALNHLLQAKASPKPLLLQVGSQLLFDEAHIPGSIYAGPGSQPAGLQRLKSAVASLAKNEAIILYCGCCPWPRCPNLGPAYKQLGDMGFTNVKVLYIADNLGTDWAAKGYPVERSH